MVEAVEVAEEAACWQRLKVEEVVARAVEEEATEVVVGCWHPSKLGGVAVVAEEVVTEAAVDSLLPLLPGELEETDASVGCGVFTGL